MSIIKSVIITRAAVVVFFVVYQSTVIKSSRNLLFNAALFLFHLIGPDQGFIAGHP
ncbi:MAG: hypothetical protein JXB23_10940 [Candidatus Aminicenantes bacterium]|nr:hypothetical protein [Candidatus Aminicenantes bacterium]